MSLRLEAEPLPDLPEIAPGDDLAALIASAGVPIGGLDVVVVSQKAVSKAEGRVVRLADVTAGPEARDLAGRLGKEPELVQLVLDESSEVLRAERP